MTLGIVSLPLEYFPDPNRGRPIYNGQIFVGEPDLDPEILANRKNIVVRQDGTEIPISPAQQPVRTGKGGVPEYNGATVQILVEGNYSIKVLGRTGAQEYYWPNVFDGQPLVVGDESLIDHNLLLNVNSNDAHSPTATGTSTARTMNDRAADIVNIRDNGAVCDGSPSDSAALISSILSGRPVEITDECEFTLNESQSITFLSNVDSVNCYKPTTINLFGGVINLSDRVLMSNPSFTNLTIKGLDSGSLSLSSVTFSGSVSDYRFTFVISGGSTSVGDYLLVNESSGTGIHKVIEGCWEVTNVIGTSITVKLPLHYTIPTHTITSATAWPLKTVIRWPPTVIGLAVTSNVREISNVVLNGSYDATTLAFSDGPLDGLQVGTSPNTPVTGLQESEQTNIGSLYMSRSGIVGFTNNATQVFGRFYGVSVAANSCGWRGWQVGRSGALIAKFSSGSANGASGYEAEEGGFLLADKSVSVGNNEQGYYAIGTGSIGMTLAQSGSNNTFGIDCRNYSSVLGDSAIVQENRIADISITAGNVLFGAGASCTGSVSVSEGGVLDAFGASVLSGTLSADALSGSRLIDVDGVDINADMTTLINDAGDTVVSAITSIGDYGIMSKLFGGSYVPLLSIKSSGQIIPVDGEMLGRKDDALSSVVIKSDSGTYYSVRVDAGGALYTTLIP